MASSEHLIRKFSPSWNLSSFIKMLHCFAPSNLADPSKQDNWRKARQHDKALSWFNHFQKLRANFASYNMPFAAKLLLLASRESSGGRYTGSEAF